MSTTYKPLYAATATAYTIAPQNVASSSSLTAGVESDALLNTSTLYSDILISGKWTCGTTPTASTVAQVSIVTPSTDDLASTQVWPDVFDGTGSAETVTSAGVMSAAIQFAMAAYIDATTSNVTYPFRQFSLRSLLGFIPARHVLFVAHNTAVNSNSTSGNHAWWPMGINDQSV